MTWEVLYDSTSKTREAQTKSKDLVQALNAALGREGERAKAKGMKGGMILIFGVWGRKSALILAPTCVGISQYLISKGRRHRAGYPVSPMITRIIQACYGLLANPPS